MKIDQTLIGLVSAATALVASVAGPVVTLLVGRQQFRASVLSVNRQRWIDALRESVSSAASQMMIAAVIRDAAPDRSRLDFSGDPATLKRIEDLMRTIAQINLLLRPNDLAHEKIRDTLETGVFMLRDPSPDTVLEHEVGQLVRDILGQTKDIVRMQWLLVKAGK